MGRPMDEDENTEACSLCNGEIGEKKGMYSDCGHPFHSCCFIIESGARYYLDNTFNCPVCVADIHVNISDAIQIRIQELDDPASLQGIQQGDKITKLLETSEPFKNEFVKLKELTKEYKKSLKHLQTPLMENVRAFRESINPLYSTIKFMRKDYIRKVTTNTLYKTAALKRGRFYRYLQSMMNTYGVNERDLARRLKIERRHLSRWYVVSRIVRRKFRVLGLYF
jgi:hypothetical protein